jgi:hypothetical protein
VHCVRQHQTAATEPDPRSRDLHFATLDGGFDDRLRFSMASEAERDTLPVSAVEIDEMHADARARHRGIATRAQRAAAGLGRP